MASDTAVPVEPGTTTLVVAGAPDRTVDGVTSPPTDVADDPQAASVPISTLAVAARTAHSRITTSAWCRAHPCAGCIFARQVSSTQVRRPMSTATSSSQDHSCRPVHYAHRPRRPNGGGAGCIQVTAPGQPR